MHKYAHRYEKDGHTEKDPYLLSLIKVGLKIFNLQSMSIIDITTDLLALGIPCPQEYDTLLKISSDNLHVRITA